MSATPLMNAAIALVVIGFLLCRQLTPRLVKTDGGARFLLILRLIGVLQLVQFVENAGWIGGFGVGLLVVSLGFAAVLSTARAYSVHVWRDSDGSWWRRSGALTLMLWLFSNRLPFRDRHSRGEVGRPGLRFAGPRRRHAAALPDGFARPAETCSSRRVTGPSRVWPAAVTPGAAVIDRRTVTGVNWRFPAPFVVAIVAAATTTISAAAFTRRALTAHVATLRDE